MHRFLIQILPAAVVAPLFFKGQIEFGVINQSSSAFNHILSDVSLVVYQVQLLHSTPCRTFSTSECAAGLKFLLPLQFEALAGFSAIIDRLGEFTEVVDSYVSPSSSNGVLPADAPLIELVDVPLNGTTSRNDQMLLSLDDVTLQTPNGAMTLIGSLSLQVGLQHGATWGL